MLILISLLGRRRLEAMAQHLRSGKLFHEEFDFSAFNRNEEYTAVGPHCGTAGCAIGELPGLDPENWQWDEYGFPILKRKEDNHSTFMQAGEYYDIRSIMSRHLFSPFHQKKEFGGEYLFNDATPKQVADNIEAFLLLTQIKESETHEPQEPDSSPAG